MTEPIRTTPHHQPSPGARTGFVFICPGRHEANRGFPCAAGTGANLSRALAVLSRQAPTRFAGLTRDKYVITNSWPIVEYPALTGRSVPRVEEVLEEANLERLLAEIQGLDTVVACGQQAQAAVTALFEQKRLSARVALARHLSQRSVNMIPGGTDTPSRIQAWCDGVMHQLAEAPVLKA